MNGWHPQPAAGASPRFKMRFWSEIKFWSVALVIGLCAGGAAVGFQLAIHALQSIVYQADDVNFLHSHLASLHWMWLIAVPTLGGLAVGLILHFFTPDARVRSVADVIQAAALREGRVDKTAGIASALSSWITLSTGGSAGREGPVVHIAALIATTTSTWINADGRTARDLMGCAVAAAVAASFNAPIAGAIFALEVVLRHYAFHAIAPILVASAAGAVVNRVLLGNGVEFDLPHEVNLDFYVELPAFLLLGLLCGMIAVLLMRSLFWADGIASSLQKNFGIPRWLRPTIAGVFLGLLATQVPMIIGVGYETTFAALAGELTWQYAILFAIMKSVAFVITIAGRMGGGVFSPSLMIGALTGLAFGIVATSLVPDYSGSPSLYALAGMGAVAACVLGAPVSTTLIVFEMTGDWQTALAVMVTISLAIAWSRRWINKSYFLELLERQNIRLAAGPHSYVLSLIPVQHVMQNITELTQEDYNTAQSQILAGVFVDISAKLDKAMPLFEMPQVYSIPVVAIGLEDGMPKAVGLLHHRNVLLAYNRALQNASNEAND